MSKYDRCDPDWRVLKLVRVSHYIWAMRENLRPTDRERVPIDEALETVFRLKRELKAEVAAEKARKWQERASRLPK